MPDAKWLNETNVKAALQDTSLEIETVDRALVRRYTQMFRFGQFERPYDARRDRRAGARRRSPATIGSQIAVLLKNDGGLLPLDAATPGPSSSSASPTFVDEACLGGGGSSKVTPLYTVPPLDGMQDVLRDLGSSATVTKVTVADDLSNLDEAKDAASERRRGGAHGRSGGHRGRRPGGRQHAERPEPDAGGAAAASTRPRSWC